VLNLKIHTEYSFRYAFGKKNDIISSQKEVVAITDKHNTFGHIPFWKECKKQGKKCILGVELSFVDDAKLKVRQNASEVVFLARNEAGLAKIYELVSKATKQRYYYPRLSYEELLHIPEDDIVVIFNDIKTTEYLKGRKNTFLGVSPLTNYETVTKCEQFEYVAISENIYDKPENEEIYHAILAGTNVAEDRVELSHILNEDEWLSEMRVLADEQKTEAIANTYKISGLISDIDFPQASLPSISNDKSLMELCEEGAKKLRIDLTDETYNFRLKREIEVISRKNFTEYFFIVKDLVDFANCYMLLGPARGSAAGSLVCFLLGITTIDPIKFDLIFERFIDINREDMPDIDIDFQDTKRDMCIDYLRDKYSNDKVAKLGTISKYKPDSLLVEFDKILDIPSRLKEDFKAAMITYSPGDARFGNSIRDTLEQTEAGQRILEAVPNIIYAADAEGHNRHFGQHAAGIIIADKSLNNYCALESDSNSCMLDKRDAEIVNLLKIDCLGLRTLTVISDCLELIGRDKDWLINFKLDCEKAFDVLNAGRFFGIFQFEGNALKNICKRVNVGCFDDISCLTALARPGAMKSGGTERYIENKDIVKYHSSCDKILEETKGVIVYQEQIMKIARDVGHMEWSRVSALRKAVAKSLGKEVMDSFYSEFEKGATEQEGLTVEECKTIWDDIVESGAYAFNKAHSVSYAMVSYWCLILKAFYPMQFALATLKNSKGEIQTFEILVELLNEGYNFELFNKDFSEVDWCIKNNVIYGGFTNIKGVGKTKAKVLITKRRNDKELTACENRTLFNPKTPYDAIEKFKESINNYHENWREYFEQKPICIKDIESAQDEIRLSVFVCDSEIKKNAKGRNFLKFSGCDNTGLLNCLLCGTYYDDYKNIISEKDALYLVSGNYQSSFGMFFIKKMKKVLDIKNNV
jgi:DNA-directed DNA polymerase III PolC